MAIQAFSKSSNPATVKVAAAVISSGSRVLITRRRKPPELAGLWEFPGGKARAGETLRQCLQREIREELCLEITVGRLLGRVTDATAAGMVEIYFFRALVACGSLQLHEHSDARWIEPERLAEFRLVPADRLFVTRFLAEEGFRDHPFPRQQRK